MALIKPAAPVKFENQPGTAFTPEPIKKAAVLPVSQPAPLDMLDAKALSEMAAAIKLLKAAKEIEASAKSAHAKAKDEFDAAVARVEHLRAKLHALAGSLAGGDGVDNFIPLSDAQAALIAKKASDARQAPLAYALSRLLS